MSMIKAVAFDWGGVLNDYTQHTYRLAQHLGLSLDMFQKAVKNHVKDFHLGLDEMEFWRRVCQEKVCQDAGVKVPSAPFWREAFDATVVINDELFSVVKVLRERGYKTLMISNTELPNKDYIEERIKNTRYDVFDVYILSCDPDVKEVKPNPGIYQIPLEILGIKPQEMVLVDDREININGLKKLGIHGILHESNNKTIKELSDLLGINLS